MKKRFLDVSIKFIKKHTKNYDDNKTDEIRYGLEGLYLSITKLAIIFIFAIILNIVKEMIFMLIIFNLLRSTGFGLHATKSWICLLSSALVFLTFPILSKIIILSFNIRIVLGIISIILIFLYAPSDTKKRPIIKKKNREIFKFKTTIKCILLVFLSLLIKNNVISNLIIFGIYNEVIMILPVTYKFFKLPYANYKTYNSLNYG